MRQKAAAGLAALLLASLAGCSENSPRASPGDGSHDEETIEIQIEIPEEDWETVLLNASQERFQMANLIIDGVTFESVGVRALANEPPVDGETADGTRLSYRIKFDAFVGGQNFQGAAELMASNMLFDPSCIRDYLTYEAFRDSGGEAGESVFAALSVNGKQLGTYLCIEPVEEGSYQEVLGAGGGVWAPLKEAPAAHSETTSTAARRDLSQQELEKAPGVGPFLLHKRSFREKEGRKRRRPADAKTPSRTGNREGGQSIIFLHRKPSA